MTSCDRLEGIRFNRKFLGVKQACRKDTVHRESARMIGRYRSLQESGLADEADLLARDYQDGHWGYAGVAHHFRALLAAHAAQQDAALAAMPAPETETAVEVAHKATSEVAEPDRPATRAPAARAAGPAP